MTCALPCLGFGMGGPAQLQGGELPEEKATWDGKPTDGAGLWIMTWAEHTVDRDPGQVVVV